MWCEGFCVVWRRVLCGVKGSVWCGEGFCGVKGSVWCGEGFYVV